MNRRPPACPVRPTPELAYASKQTDAIPPKRRPMSEHMRGLIIAAIALAIMAILLAIEWLVVAIHTRSGWFTHWT